MNTPRSCTANNVVPRFIVIEYPQNCTANTVVLRFTGNEYPQNCTANFVVLGFNGNEYLPTYRVTDKQATRNHVKLYFRLSKQQQNSKEHNKSTKTPPLTK